MQPIPVSSNMTDDERERWAYAEGDVRIAALLRKRQPEPKEIERAFEEGRLEGRQEGYDEGYNDGCTE